MGPTKEAKLPVRQMAILAVCRFAEPVALTSVYPYLPEMIESFGIPTDKVARWAGTASACFSLCQCLTAVIWGQMSDRFGRKYLILSSLTCTMITSLVFGMSQSLPAMLTARALGGAAAGNVGIIRTMIAEMVPAKELQPLAYSVMPIVWVIGSIVGPSFGGLLAMPAEKYPSIFGGSPFFQKYPFLLPNLIAAILFIVGVTVGILFLRETLAARKNSRDYGLILGKALTSLCHKRPKTHRRSWQSVDESEALVGEHEDSWNDPKKGKNEPPKRRSYRDVLTRQSNVNLIAYTLLAMHSQAYDQLVPIFMHHPEQAINDPHVELPFRFSGGFGITSGRIGAIFTLNGVAGMLIQFLAFPPLARKFGVLRCFRWVAVVFPFVYFLTPFTSLLPSQLEKQLVMILFMLVKCWMGIFAFPCSTILLTNSAASLAVLGTLNGIATSTSAIGRAAGPFLSGNLFTFAIDRGFVIAPWWLLSFISAVAAIPVFYLKEMDGFSATDDSSEDEDLEDTESELQSPTTDRSKNSFAIEEEEEEEEGEDDDVSKSDDDDNLRLGSRSQARRFSAIEPRMSSPLGMANIGPPHARRFSNNLGPTRAGLGTGSDIGGGVG